MRRIDKLITYYCLSASAMFIMAATVLFMPYAVENGEQNRLVVVAVGLIFWASAIAGYGFIIAANIVRKKIMSLMSGSYSSLSGRPGIITFFSNVYATVADTTMILSFVIFIMINLTELKTTFFAYIFLFLLIFSIHMHCLFNGKIFKVIQVSRTIKHARRDKSHE